MLPEFFPSRKRIDNVNTKGYVVDRHYTYGELCFVWDRSKAEQNIQKHGIAFELAVQVFWDPLVTVIDASPEEEVRDAAIGLDDAFQLLVVVFALIEDERIQILSVRKATGAERWTYENK